MSMESLLLESALKQREQSDFGRTVTYGKLSAPCSVGTMGFGGRLTSGGISAHSEVTIVVRTSALPGPFKSGDWITLTDKKGVTMKLKIASEGITYAQFFTELILSAVAEGVK